MKRPCSKGRSGWQNVSFYGKYGASLAAFQIEKPETYTNSAGYFVADGDQRHRGIAASKRPCSANRTRACA
jgi:hypothetical protein